MTETKRVRTESPAVTEAIGQSEAFIVFQEQLSRVAPVDRPVLILGERGTGKELAAARIHFLSRRWQRPLVTMNCAALAPGLIESELFGYEKGAFTGALGRKAGRFEKASEGTLFLDEIGTLPMVVQEKILRVVEYGSFERVGSSDPVRSDVRIVAATNADLKSMVRTGRFKQDLLDRLSFEVIYVPPLRKRKEDILILARHFAGRMAYELGWEDPPKISAQAVHALENHPWPGNVRELKNVVERAVYKCSGRVLSEIVFDPFQSSLMVDPAVAGPEKTMARPGPDKGAGGNEAGVLIKPFKEAVADLEKNLLNQALKDCRFHQKAAAEKLGLTYHQFRGLLKKHAGSQDKTKAE